MADEISDGASKAGLFEELTARPCGRALTGAELSSG